MMYRVCIADDEKYVLKSIVQRINNSGMELEVVGTALNGLEALTLFEKEKPDIFFVDISMPFVSGLDFIERVKKQNYELPTQFVIISGYDDFAYMKRAIKLGVVNYIKKPILQDEFQEMLLEVCQILKDRNEKHKKKKNMIIQSWTDFFEKGQKSGISGTVLLIRKKSIGLDPETIVHTLENLGTQGWQIVVFGKENLDVVMYFLEGRTLGESVMRQISVIDTLREASQIIYSFPQKQQPEEMIYLLENQLNLRFYCATSRFMKLSEMKHEKLTISYEAFDASLDNVREERYSECIEKIINNVLSDVRFSYLLKQVFQSMILIIANKYIKYDIQIPTHIQQELFPFALSVYQNSQELVESLIGYSYELNQKIVLLFSGCDLVDKVTRYVDQHYQEEINLTDISSRFYVVPTYLARRFKEKKNCTVMQYVEEVRMQKSKELLESSDISILEVAQMVGYNDQNYFARSFRRKYGISPREYRNSCR